MLSDHDEYLRTHGWALLSTTRADGSPQVSMVAQHFDGTDIAISCRRSSAKFVNTNRDPRVVVTVPDGRRYLAVAGTAELITAGPRLVDLTLRLLSSLGPDDARVLQRDIDVGLEAVGRAIVRVTPERVLGRI